MPQAIVVNKPLSINTGSSPVFISRKLPVPYVDFVSPFSKQVCPNNAHCWSPAAPAILIGPPNIVVIVSP